MRPYFRQRIRLILKSGDVAAMIGPVVFASSWDELGTLAAEHPGSPAIVDPGLNGTRIISSPERDKRPRRPDYALPVIAYPCSDVHMRSGPDEGAVSATHVKECDVGDIRALELAVLQNIDAQRIHRLLARGEERTPAGASRILRRVFRRAVEPCRVGDLAADLGVTERTLQRWCRQMGIARPKKLSALARVFTVARLLHWSKRPMNAVALALGFSNEPNCYRLLRRILGSTLSRNMTRSAVDRVEEVILREMVGSSRVSESPGSKSRRDPLH